MEIFLYNDDLKPEYRCLVASQIKFHMFTPAAQRAIRAKGEAMYRTNFSFATGRYTNHTNIIAPARKK